MATRWRTEPISSEASQGRPKRPQAHVTTVSADSTSTRDRSNSGPSRLPRPQIYVHFEFGVTLSPSRPHNRRSFTYTSKQYHREPQNFPRSVPAPTTNYLVPSSAQDPWRQPSEPQEAQRIANADQPVRPTASAFAVQRPHSPDYFQFQSVPPLQASARPSRNGSRGSSSHERGSSAPPPWNHSPWDEEPEPLGSSALPARPRADVWKTLPPLPTSYRLSEQINDGPAWSPFSWPEEYGFPDAADEEHPGRSRNAPAHPSAIMVTRPDEDPEPRRELERLGSAMATVDNGFEGQWWYQGERELMARQLETGEIVTLPQEYAQLFCQGPYMTTSLPNSPMDSHSRSPTWTISRRPVEQNLNSIVSPSDDPHTPQRATTFDMSTVSPITASDATSPRPSGLDRVHTMPLRSDELFMSI